MARIQSLGILLEQTGNDFLSELYGKVIENVEKGLISGPMKNRDLSGNPESGTVEAKLRKTCVKKDFAFETFAAQIEALGRMNDADGGVTFFDPLFA